MQDPGSSYDPDFDEVLQQVVDLLKSDQRSSYRALKKRFRISDDDLEAIKDELIDAKRLAVDENGKVLVWVGGRQGSGEAEYQAPSVTPGLLPPEAERRQLTVAFCDMVGSTQLAGQLDPEDWRELLQQYQSCVSGVVDLFDGHIAQYLGDGILIYFGFPRAHADDARRAVRACLEIMHAIESLNERLRAERSLRLRIRLGVHTGPVVVGDVGAGARHEQLALGETPNLAARLEGIAEPGSILISGDTHRLLDQQFHYESLGERQLKGIAEPVPVYRVLADSGIRSRFDLAATGVVLPMIGRQAEMDWLVKYWNKAAVGNGQSVLITGEHGVGKSRLVQALKEYVSAHSGRWGVMRGSPYFHNSPLHPVIDIWREAMGWKSEDSDAIKLEKLESSLSQSYLPLAESVPLFAPLFRLPLPPGKYPKIAMSPERQKRNTMDILTRLVLEFGYRRPFMLVVEDLQLIDPTTAEWLTMMVRRIESARLMLLFTCQPSVTASCIPEKHVSVLRIGRLESGDVKRMVLAVTGGKPLPEEMLAQIIDHTDGIPAAVEEVTRMLLESDLLVEQDDQYCLTGSLETLGIPTTLQDSLMARLDQLATAKPVAQLCATLGRYFDFEILAAMSALDRQSLTRELDRLVRAGVLAQRGEPPDASYNFRHSMLQQAAYQSLLKKTRRGYHGQIADTLHKRFPHTPAEVIAYHYTEARQPTRAIEYWRKAGLAAIEQSANQEAVAHLAKGLDLVPSVKEDNERTALELNLQINSGPAMIALKGWAAPEVAEIYTRARELCKQLKDSSQAPRVLVGLAAFHIVRADYRTAHEITRELFELARADETGEAAVAAEATLGCILMNLGQPKEAIEHLGKGLIDPLPASHVWMSYHYGQHPRVFCLAMTGRALWLLGYPDQALESAIQAVELAREISHPLSEAFALEWLGGIHLSRREFEQAHRSAREAMSLSTDQAFPMYRATAMLMRGAIAVHDGRGEDGIEMIKDGLAGIRSTGARANLPYYLSILAESYASLSMTEESLATLDQAVEVIKHTGESWWLAEMHRLRGESLKLQGKADRAAEVCFEEALMTARQQKARSLELRAALSLGRIWLAQERPVDAKALLDPLIGEFDEGLETGDLAEAVDLLDRLQA
jgi:class 3 adenylate cyclase/predicted ATPase/energy-coupling factor transporter ATP-binding protein EcfA2